MDTPKIKQLLEQHERLLEEAAVIRDKTDPWTDEERERLEKIGTDVVQLQADVERLRAIEKSRKWAESPRGTSDDDPAGDPTPASRVFRLPGDPEADPVERNDVAQYRTALQTAEKVGFTQAIDEYVELGFRQAVTEWLKAEPQEALSETSRVWLSEDAVGGGYLVPPMPLIMMLIEEQRNDVFIEELSEVRTVPSIKGYSIPRLDARPSDPDWTSETPAKGTGDTQMAFGRLRFEPRAMRGLIAEFSADELEKDEIDIEATWRSNLQYLVGIKKENAYLTGDGVNKPVGIFVAHDDGIPTSRDVNSGSNSAITFTGLVNALFALKEQYQMRSTWIFGRKAMAQIFGLQDNEGRPVWQSVSMGPGGDFRGMILNRPYRLSEYVPNANKATAFAANDYVGVIADFRAGYHVTRTTYMRMIRDIYTRADENIIAIYTRFYGDGKPKLAEAFARVQIGA